MENRRINHVSGNVRSGIISLIILIMAVSLPEGFSQTPEIDSLQYELDREKGEGRIGILLELSEAFLKVEPARAINYAEDALQAAAEFKDQEGQSMAIMIIGRGYYRLGNYGKAMGYFQQADKQGREANNIYVLARSNIYIGNVFAMMEQRTKAIRHYRKAFQLNSDQKTNAQALTNIGNNYLKMNRLDSARIYLEWSTEIRIRMNDIEGLAQSYNNLAVLYTEQGKLDKALSYYEDALSIRKDKNDKGGIAEIYNNMALIYSEKEQFQKAIELLQKSQEIARDMGLNKLLSTNNKLTAEIYAKRSDYQKAYEHQKIYADLKDSLINEKTLDQINKLQSQHEFDKIKKENEELNSRLRNGSVYSRLFYSIAFLFLLAIGYIILQYRKKLKHDQLLNEKNEKITEQKQNLEETLNIFYDSEKRRKAILKAIPDSMFVCNPAGQLLDFHSRSEDLAFLRSEVVLGRSMEDVFPSDFVSRAKAYIRKTNDLGEIHLFEFMHGKGDEVRYYEARMGKSSEKEFLFIIRDITERNKAKFDLERQINFLQVLIDDIPVPVFYKDKKGRYLGCNKEFSKILGREKEDIIGKNIYEVSTDNNQTDLFFQKDRELLEGGGLQRFETKMRYADGRYREVIFYKTVFYDIDGSVGGLIGSIVDVTESKKYEQTLKESEQKMRELNATKDKFFSIIAHDLKTPFNAIMGFSNLLYDSYDSFDEEEKKEFIKNISEASDSTFKLLQNLLQWSRAQTGTIEMRPESIDLSVLVNENISVLKTHADNKSIRLHSHIDFRTMAYADPNMITTVLRNFISNAIKFTYENGHIEVFAADSNGEVVVTVRDDGIGIEKDNLEKVFRIDKQFRKEGTANEQGTGIGLILCKEFIERNGGRIWVESEYEKGSDFKFSLPKSKSLPISKQ